MSSESPSLQSFWETDPHVVLCSPPPGQLPRWVPRKKAFFEHHGLELVASAVREGGFDVEVVDALAESLTLDDLETLIRRHDRRLRAVGVFLEYKEFEATRRFIAWLRATYPTVLVFTGGPTLEAAQIERVLREARAHCLVVGEGEHTTREIVERWVRGARDLTPVRGLYTLSPAGAVVNTGTRPPQVNLDALPIARRDVLRRLLARGERELWASFSTLRGCYYPCAFCYINSDYFRESMGRTARARSVESVLDELAYLRDIGVRNINFVDSTFFLPGPRGQARAIAIARGIVERHMALTLNMLARATDIHDESIAWLRRAGLVRTFIGIESFVQRTLDFLKKGSTVEQNIHAIETLRRHGVKVSYGLIIADPYTSVAELRTTVEHLDRLGLVLRAVSHLLLTNVVLVYPNTPLERTLAASGLLAENAYFRGGKFRFLHGEVAPFLEMAAHLERVWSYTYEIDLRWSRLRATEAEVHAIKTEATRRFVPWATRLLYQTLDMLEGEPDVEVATARVRALIRDESMVPDYTPTRSPLAVTPAAAAVATVVA